MSGGGLIALVIRRPVTVMVGVILVLLFGALSVAGLPIQLTPDIDIPTLTVTTVWPGASPPEVERELLIEQEEVLKSVQGVDKLTAEASAGQGVITLEFEVGTPLDEALVRVSNRLTQVPDYPETARQPVVTTADGAGPPLAVLTIVSTDGRAVAPYRTWFEQEVLPSYERIPGIAGVRYFGGQDSQVEIRFDPAALAARGVPIGALTQAVRAELADQSAGRLDLGKRAFVVRTAVAPDPVERLEDLVLRSGAALGGAGQAPVRLGEVAQVELGLRKRDRKVLTDGAEGMALIFDREAGSNVLEVTEQILATTDRVNAEQLASRGLFIKVVSDQTGYINGALALVRNNILLGGALAVGVLYLFLRNLASSIIIATAIPICVAGTALGMAVLGRTVNVVSLAGTAFAVGMVVDSAIVVLENIDTWRSRVAGAAEAAYEGTREVWAAILASTLTTIAVFAPIVTWQDEVGELLRDVAVAVCFSVGLSLLVAVLVIPSLAARVRGGGAVLEGGLAARTRAAITRQVRGLVGSPARSLTLSLGTLVGAAALAAWLLPAMEYLPTGNRNFLFGVVIPPPGYSMDEMAAVGERIHMPIAANIGEGQDGAPAVGRTFFAALPGQGFMGASAARDEDIGALVQYVRGVLRTVPGVFGVASQASLFGRNIGSSRAVDVEISGADLEGMLALGGRMMGAIGKAVPDAQVRPLPSLDLGGPELRVKPRREDARALGVDATELALAVDAAVDGRIIGELGEAGEQKLDVVLMALPEPTSPSELLSLPVVTANGQVVPLGAVADLEETLSPTTIRRIERRRAITLQVSPPEAMAVEEAMERIRDQVVAPLEAEGAIPDGVRIELAGVADKLTEAQGRMGEVLMLAVLICYLLMAALFEDFIGPLVILTTVPFAAVGGVVGLVAVNTFLSPQPLDMLTALGFVLLIGVVVNNAILIVDGALERLRAGERLVDAVPEAVGGRVRPILMSSLTSLAGLLPLVLFPGSGSELYRGVGAVVLGGLGLSTLLSLYVVPAVFALVWRLRGAT